MAKQSLERSTGPLARTEIDGTEYELGGWELFENDPDNPNNCRGWVRIGDDAPAVKTKTQMRLYLATDDGEVRILDVKVTHISSTEPLWEFVAV